MMGCDQIKSRLGEMLDGELSDELCPAVELHLEECPDCRVDYESLRLLAAELAQPPSAQPPAELWGAIEERLDAARLGSAPPHDHSTGHGVIFHLGGRLLAAAAIVVLAVGLGWLSLNAPWESRALAARIDFRPLLEQADGDVAAGIQALMAAHGGERVTAAQAAERVKVRVQAPDKLPGEMELAARYMLSMGRDHRALAFHYTGPAGYLLLLQCPPKIEKNYGGNECMSCRVGSHDGHGMRVGKLWLMHMESENVCICIVSTLDEQSELPAALDAIQIDY